MSFFKKMLSSIGIGSAKIDLVLEEDTYSPGDSIRAVAHITGGKTEQRIEGLYFTILCNYEATEKRAVFNEEQEDDEEHAFEDEERIEYEEVTVTRYAILDKFEITESFVMGEGEEKEIELEFELPSFTPLTLGHTKVWIKTGLDIKKGKDAGDKDYINVVPHEPLMALFNAVEELGFELAEAECEEVPDSFWHPQPFVQEFEFKPAHGEFFGRVEELEVIYLLKEEYANVFFEIDRHQKGFQRLATLLVNSDESRVSFSYSINETDDLKQKVYEILSDYA